MLNLSILYFVLLVSVVLSGNGSDKVDHGINFTLPVEFFNGYNPLWIYVNYYADG